LRAGVSVTSLTCPLVLQRLGWLEQKTRAAGGGNAYPFVTIAGLVLVVCMVSLQPVTATATATSVAKRITYHLLSLSSRQQASQKLVNQSLKRYFPPIYITICYQTAEIG
jgi:hypothetical protein